MQSCIPLVLRNVSLSGGRVADIAVRDGVVSHAGAGGPTDRIIDCRGLFVLPAAVDMHVHMRGGAQSAKEDWGSGSRSALAGGVTVVVDQPNTLPPINNPDALRARVFEAKSHSLCSFAINSSVTFDTPVKAMWSSGAMAFGETFFARSSYGEAISSQELGTALREIHTCGALATIHAEEIAEGDDRDLVFHDTLRSVAGELRAVEAIRECNTAGCRLHFCHMSTMASVTAAAAAGSVEVTPHHLFLSHEQFRPDDTYGKVNPPLRSEKERKGLWAAWKTIDVIASDHAPHTPAEKQVPFRVAPSGIPGVETMVPLLLGAVLAKKASLPDVIRKTSQEPAELLGIPPAGFVPGDRGDFALYPKESVRIDPDTLHSRCGFSPFAGLPAVFPRLVILGGTVVYEEGEFSAGSPVWFAGNGYYP
ncbi:MAG: dihydroorotase [Methanoregula sp.]|jgi:dihydroorotase|uniref:dihydroorotase n=1 Tax=Methanoregula sp. TaxID=2052170 RepID=UPI003C25EEFC